MELKTPLYDRHEALDGRIVPFAGYLLPVQYAGVIEEHMAVRERAGLFDVSHMGEVMITGEGALGCLGHLLANDFTNLAAGKVRYSPLLNDDGGMLDDVLVYKFADDRYLVVVNASNRRKDVDWMKAHMTEGATLEDISDSVAQLALQGPAAQGILEKLAAPASIPAKYYSFVDKLSVAGVACLVSRTGYTGEDGLELYCNPKDAPKLWDALLDAGKDDGLVPCGLGARDTLRLEAAMPLYGHEMDETVSPLETGLSFAVKMKKPEFIGKSGLEKRGEPKKTRVGLKVTGRGIVREHCPVFAGDKQIGETTSGTHLPYLKGAYAMALVDIAHKEIGTQIDVDVRGRKIAAEVVALPFYKSAGK
jgi:aminomethyltransferase